MNNEAIDYLALTDERFRMRRIVHGTPITPRHLLNTLAGESFCVSFADPRDLDRCIELVGDDQILILDNGAFSIWQAKLKGRKLPKRLQFADQDEYRQAFWDWANEAQARCPQAVAVIPDVIEGSEHANLLELSYALRYEMAEYPERCMAIWHLDDSIEQLTTMARICNFVGFGSCAEFDVQTEREAYMERITHASAAIDYCEQIHARRPWIHLMRGLGVLHELVRFESADSTNVARNHSRYKQHGDDRCKMMADRISEKVHTKAYAAPVGRTFPTTNFG